jgi:hypothetical protein
MPCGMIQILIDKIQGTFLVKFLPASLLGVSAAKRAENSGVWIGNDDKSDWEHTRSEYGRSCMGLLYNTTP